MNVKAYKLAALNANWAWGLELMEQISAILISQAMFFFNSPKHKVRGQKISFQNAIFKNLVWSYMAQSFYIWYIASSRGPLPNIYEYLKNGMVK